MEALLAGFTAFGGIAAVCLVLLLSVVFAVQSGRVQGRLQEQSLHLEGAVLQQRDKSGRVIAQLRLDEPLTYEYLDRANEFAIYRLRQGDTVLDFASTAPEAEEIVTAHLGLEWPPVDGPTFTA